MPGNHDKLRSKFDHEHPWFLVSGTDEGKVVRVSLPGSLFPPDYYEDVRS